MTHPPMARDQLNRRWDVVIAGGGHNGLVAAAYLARTGLSVLVAERAERLGGATNSAEIFPGVPAYVSRYSYLVSLLPERIVAELGLRIELRERRYSGCAPYKADGDDRILLLAGADAAEAEESLRELGGPTAAPGLGKLIRLERALAERAFPSMLEPLRSRQQWTESLDGPLEREAWEWLVERPIGELIERVIDSDLLRGVVLSDSKIGVVAGAHDASLLQNRTFLLHVIGRGDARWLVPVGGMGALAAELERAAREAGAELRTRIEVISAERSGSKGRGLALGVRSDDSELELEAGHLLFCGGPRAMARVLGEEHEPRAEDEGSVAKVNVVCERLPQLRCGLDPAKAFAGTFHLCEGYEELAHSHREASAGRLPERLPAELYCHTLTDDSILAPELRERGWQTLTLFGLDVPYSTCAADPIGVREKLWRRYVSQMDELLAEPFEGCIAQDRDGAPCVEVVTAADIERELWLERGNIFANAPSWFFADGEEPGSWGTATSMPGVHRCGSSAARGGAVSGIPGHNAARAVLEKLGRAPDGLERARYPQAT